MIHVYSNAAQKFNATMGSVELTSIKKYFPKNLLQAVKIIGIDTHKQNYKKYNEAAIKDIESSLASTDNDFVRMVNIAKLENGISTKPYSFGAFPVGSSGLDSSTYHAAKK